MSEPRNPYTATNVPLEAQNSASPNAFGSAAVEYGGFWRRVGALFLDGLILLPVTLLVIFGPGLSRYFYVYYLVPGILFMAFYYMYLVVRHGGTPGKRILDMRIVMLNGAPVTPKAAVLRNLVEWVIGALATLALALASLQITDTELEAAGYFEKLTLLREHAPRWNMFAVYGAYAWWVVGAIIMLCNDKRRGAHDLLAGTVVIRTA